MESSLNSTQDTAKPTSRLIVKVVIAGVLFAAVALGVVQWRIHQDVRGNCDIAQKAHPHPGDDVAALKDFMNSTSHSLRDRDRAVWALGRLCDAKVLPALKAGYSGEACDHDHRLCQYELSKAIKRCGEAPNPPMKPKCLK